jgi:hypothetical protein
LPVKEILRDHFEHIYINEKSNSEIEKTKNLQKILMKEIMETRREKEEYMNNVDQERYFDDHVDEKTINENTKDIVVNDILSDNIDVVEPYYENANIIDKSPIVIDTPVTVEEKLNGYKGLLENKPEEEVIVKKLDDNVANDVVANDVVANDDLQNNNLNDIVIGGNNSNNDITNNIISDDTKNISMVESIRESISETIQDDTNIKTVGIGKVESVVEEVKVVDDRDETMTIDNFMNDVNDLLSDKKPDDNFTLFNDAKEIES